MFALWSFKVILDYATDVHDDDVDVFVTNGGEKKKKRNLKISSSDFIVKSMSNDSLFLNF